MAVPFVVSPTCLLSVSLYRFPPDCILKLFVVSSDYLNHTFLNSMVGLVTFNSFALGMSCIILSSCINLQKWNMSTNPVTAILKIVPRKKRGANIWIIYTCTVTNTPMSISWPMMS